MVIAEEPASPLKRTLSEGEMETELSEGEMETEAAVEGARIT